MINKLPFSDFHHKNKNIILNHSVFEKIGVSENREHIDFFIIGKSAGIET